MPLLWSFALAQESSAQENVSLKELLNEWQRNNDFEYSGRDDLLSQCMVPDSVHSIDELSKHLSSCKLAYELRNGVFIIFKNEKLYSLVGYVKDAETGMPIPNVTVKLGDIGTTTSNDGYFFLITNDTFATVEVSHVSYNAQHLKLNTSIDHHIELVPRIITLAEVVIVGNSINSSEKSNNTSEKSNVLNGRRISQLRLFRNINDLLNNRPSDEISTFVNERKQGLDITYYRLKVSKKMGRKMGRVFSFSDETGFYINPRKPKLRKRTNFFKADSIGDFIHFIEMASVTSVGYTYSYQAEQLLDIRSGKVKSLTRSLLRELIADDQQLLEMFNNEKGKSAKLASYLREYYFRKKNVISGRVFPYLCGVIVDSPKK